MQKNNKNSAKNILNIAHRGDSTGFPENTMAAFNGAVEAGADMIELDVRLSQDRVPVIFHNAWLDTPIEAAGFVAHSALEALKKLDAGSWFHPEFADQRIPTLEEVLVFAKDTIGLNIEIKTNEQPSEGRAERACLELIKKHEMENEVLFSSFDAAAIERIKRYEPSVFTALLYTHSIAERRNPSELMEACNADVFHCTYMQLTPKRLADLKEHHIPVTVYTVNDKSRMKKLIAMGINGIITDRPNLLREVILTMQ